MGGLLSGLWHVPVEDEFDADRSHPNITLENNRRTARVTNISRGEVAQVVMGRDTYNVGRHLFRFRLDNIPVNCSTWIGTTSNNSPPLNDVRHHQGHTVWHVLLPLQMNGPNSGDEFKFHEGLSRPWRTGDVIVLKLDCENHTLIVYHEPSGMSHTIHNVTGPQRVFLAMRPLNTTISLEHNVD